MNEFPPRSRPSYGYDSARLSLTRIGTPIFGYDAHANWYLTINLGASLEATTGLGKFTGKERDSESGLDYFEARYYGSALGRFTSPDDGSDNDPADPQSWNLYAYVWNNPMANTDPYGHGCQTTTFTQTDSNGNVIARDYLADFSDCSRRLILGTASLMIQSMIPSIRAGQNALDWASRSRNENCLAASTAAGASIGAGYGLFGLAGGPAVGITEPTAMGIGGGLGWAGGMVSCMSGSGGSGGGTGGNSGSTNGGRKWKWGTHKSAQKAANQMGARGWTDAQIDEAIEHGTQYPAPNNINPQNGATRYVNPTTGRSVVLDNVTKEVLHVGGDGFKY